MERTSRFGLIALAALAALVVAQPAMAYTELRTTGIVGAHSMADGRGHPAVDCSYGFVDAENVYELNHIDVYPPNIKAIAGMGDEKVAWNFTVQRRTVGLFGTGPWRNRYTSPKFSAITDASNNAVFSYVGVRVTVPYALGSDASAQYRVNVKMFWYDSGGTSVVGTVAARLNWYLAFAGIEPFRQRNRCSDYVG